MKITDYPKVTDLNALDVLLTDGERGTKTIYAQDFIGAASDAALLPMMHRMLYRGKNLGSEVTADQLAEIRAGTFKDLYLGDYWVINNITWRIADFDYWLHCGDTEFLNHHLVIVPDENLGNQQMNATNITTGGYTGSAMYTANLATAKSLISGAFGSNVLTKREYLTNAVHATGDYPSAGAWFDSSVELMNEPMVYGSYIFTPAVAGNTTTAVVVVNRYTVGKSQLALFMVDPTKITTRYNYWLRDVVSAAAFAYVHYNGGAHYNSASNSYGVRPCFPIG